MAKPMVARCAMVCTFVASAATGASGQVLESVGGRALGMGGAFVAVANDSSATWWNPAALADGPFLDMALSRMVNEQKERVPARRDRVSGFALATPPLGVSFYRLRITEARDSASIGALEGGRQVGEGDVALRSWSASQLGGTFVQTLLTGVHVGTTVKWVRGTARTGGESAVVDADDLLERSDALDGGQAENRFDLDIGALATAGPLRLGAVARNVRQPTFGDGAFRLPRQIRAGIAVDVEKAGGTPLTLAFDADVRAYSAGGTPRRVWAVGAEQWLAARRIGIRAGARFNREAEDARAFSAGGSVAVRSGLYLDAFVVRGGSPTEQGWGAAARVSF